MARTGPVGERGVGGSAVGVCTWAGSWLGRSGEFAEGVEGVGSVMMARGRSQYHDEYWKMSSAPPSARWLLWVGFVGYLPALGHGGLESDVKFVDVQAVEAEQHWQVHFAQASKVSAVIVSPTDPATVFAAAGPCVHALRAEVGRDHPLGCSVSVGPSLAKWQVGKGISLAHACSAAADHTWRPLQRLGLGLREWKCPWAGGLVLGACAR